MDLMNSVFLKGTENEHVAGHGHLVVQDPKLFSAAEWWKYCALLVTSMKLCTVVVFYLLNNIRYGAN